MTFTEYLNSQYAVTDRLDSITGQQILPEDDGGACDCGACDCGASSGEGSAGTVSADIATVDNRVFDNDIVKRKDLDDKTNLAHLLRTL